MAETSYYWPGTVTGDATLAPYDDAKFGLLLRTLLDDDTLQGVLPKYLNKLEVTNPGGTTVRVNTGAAIVYDKLYVNTTAVDLAAGVAGGYYTVVLRKSWANQQVRLDILGPNMVAYPAVTQNAGVTWEIAIAFVLNTAGVLTITNNRIMVNAPFGVKVYNTNALGDQQILPDSADTPIVWNHVEWDEASMFDLVSTTQLFCRLAGRYIITAHLDMGNDGVGVRYIRIYLNGGVSAESVSGSEVYAGGTWGMAMIVVAHMNLAVGDYIELYGYQSSGVNLTIGGPNYMSMAYDG